MTVESATYIDDLDTSNPGDTDQILEGDNHIRLLKSVLKNTFSGITGEVKATQADLPLGNKSATTAPTVNEDSGDDYAVGSIWCDTTNDRVYICLDNTLGAAVWVEIGNDQAFEFTSTRRLLFGNTIETGWTLVSISDYLVMLGNSPGNTGGNWSLNMSTNLPNHTHSDGNLSVNIPNIQTGDTNTNAESGDSGNKSVTGNTGNPNSNPSISVNTSSWRPLNRVVSMAAKD